MKVCVLTVTYSDPLSRRMMSYDGSGKLSVLTVIHYRERVIPHVQFVSMIRCRVNSYLCYLRRFQVFPVSDFRYRFYFILMFLYPWDPTWA